MTYAQWHKVASRLATMSMQALFADQDAISLMIHHELRHTPTVINY